MGQPASPRWGGAREIKSDGHHRSQSPQKVNGDVRLFFRYLVFGVLFSLGSCLAQVVTIRVVNAKNGQPLQGRQVSVSLLYEKDEPVPEKYDANLSLLTDANGEVHFALSNPAPAHISAQVRVPESWRCACGVLATTEELTRSGIVASRATAGSGKPATPAKAVPGEIVFSARPLSFWERLLYPFVKG